MYYIINPKMLNEIREKKKVLIIELVNKFGASTDTDLRHLESLNAVMIDPPYVIYKGEPDRQKA